MFHVEVISMASAPQDQTSIDWLLKKRIEEIGTMFRAIWDNYIKFYTVFLTFSLGALGWLIEHGESKALTHSHTVIVIVFMGQSILTSITSVAVAIYSRRMAQDLASLEQELLATASKPSVILSANPIPVSIALWAGIANAFAMLGMTAEWYRVGFGK
jgi:hypothetical protein